MKRIKTTFVYVFLSISSFLSIFPFLWMIIGATNTSKDVSAGKLTPGTNFLTNFKNLCSSVDLGRVIGNSVVITVISTILAIVLSSMAGYAFFVFKSKWLDKVFGVLILSMMIPFAAIMIPLFRLFSQMGLLNSYASVILPSAATAFLIFFFRQNTESFPLELIQAARVDGLDEFRIFVKIFMPTMKATYAAAGIITFMNTWNNFLWPLIALQTNDKKTLPLIISYLSSAYTPDYGVIMMVIIIATAPTLLVFFLMQKNFVEGMVGSVKG